ncbi:uncharacterized protein LOC115884873 [Sitophilus oryzae]|uniref:Uncharacterized protein LOC115884873 n=1 Tax=Sitophilus oryzae TaxID=7048 RepID=A0A6J2Y746_SITOR|nr:uncharacterized protein LOC115884873 [Sitophilus oryzae]
METFNFNNICQKENQSIDSFITELKRQAANCEFICSNGLSNKQIQQRLIRENEMSLTKIQEYCKSIELSQQHIKLLSPNEENINAVEITFKCRRCGYKHTKGRCPAFHKTCVVCNKGHFAKMCKSKVEDTIPIQSKKNEVEESERQEDRNIKNKIEVKNDQRTLSNTEM